MKIDGLTGPRLFLRKTTERDHSQIQSWLSVPSHWWGFMGTDLDYNTWFSQFASLAPDTSRAHLLTAIEHKSSKPVAFVSLKPSYPWPWNWEGEAISDPETTGMGYGREAFALGLRFAFTEGSAKRVSGPVAADNIASRRTVEGLGFTYEGTLREHFRRVDDSTVDAYIYGILKSEWKDPFQTRVPISDDIETGRTHGL